MNCIEEMPINRKLTLIIVVTCATALLLVGAASLITNELSTRKARVDELTVLADLLGSYGTAALSFHRDEDIEDIQEILYALKADKHIVEARFYDKDRLPFGEYVREGAARDFPQGLPVYGAHFTDNYLEFFDPIEIDQKLIGFVYLRADLGRIYEQRRHQGIVVSVVFLFVISLTFFISPLIRQPITMPILALAKVAHEIAQRRDYTVRAVKEGKDEIGLLTDAFNQMLDEIEAGQKSIQKSLQSIQEEIVVRKRAEQNARRLAAIVEYSDNAIIGKDLYSVITSWNKGAEKIFGYTATEMIGQSIHRIFPPHLINEESDIMAKIKKGEPIDHFETVRMTKERALIDVSVTVSPIKDEDGRIVGASTVAHDITERKLAENQIYKLNNELEMRVKERTVELEKANKELEAFSYTISHDLRAPLRTMDGFSQIIEDDCGAELSEVAKKYLKMIRKGATQMGTLIDDLLSFSRLSRSSLEKRPVETHHLVVETWESLASLREGRKMDLDLKPLPVSQGDPALLKQVWINLISNALKYTRQRDVTRIEIGATLSEGKTAYYIRDNGVGFDMKYSHKLFGVFQRLHRAEDYEGTGVGLAIVQRIVHRHDGQIWAESRLDQGTTFYFTL